MIRSFTKIILVGTVAFLAGACDSVNTIEREQPIAPIDPIVARKFEPDSGISDFARLVDLRQGTVSGDLLRVDATLFNNRYTQARFNYKFEWLDDHGLIVDTPLSVWTPQIIEAKEKVVLTGIAPNPRAKDFRLKLEKTKR